VREFFHCWVLRIYTRFLVVPNFHICCQWFTFNYNNMACHHNTDSSILECFMILSRFKDKVLYKKSKGLPSILTSVFLNKRDYLQFCFGSSIFFHYFPLLVMQITNKYVLIDKISFRSLVKAILCQSIMKYKKSNIYIESWNKL
jgi:hypothetical protein